MTDKVELGAPKFKSITLSEWDLERAKAVIEITSRPWMTLSVDDLARLKVNAEILANMIQINWENSND